MNSTSMTQSGRMVRWWLLVTLVLILAVFAFIIMNSASGVVPAQAANYALTVNGSGPYAPTKIVGQVGDETVHFETPETSVNSASVSGDRNQTWTGNGSEHLPCPGGIHWISNSNVLTISNCLSSTSTTVASTTIPQTTTTVATTTTVESTTTTMPGSTVVPTSTTVQVTTTARGTSSSTPSTTSGFGHTP